MLERSNIKHKVSLFWGLITLKNMAVEVGHKDGFEDTWHEETESGNSEGRFRYFKIVVDSTDTLSIHDWENVYCGRSDITLSGEQINTRNVSVPQSCVASIAQGVVGYRSRYIYEASDK